MLGSFGSSASAPLKAKGPRSSTTISIRQIDNLQASSKSKTSSSSSSSSIYNAGPPLSQKPLVNNNLPQRPSTSYFPAQTNPGSETPHKARPHKQQPHLPSAASNPTPASTSYSIKPAASIATYDSLASHYKSSANATSLGSVQAHLNALSSSSMPTSRQKIARKNVVPPVAAAAKTITNTTAETLHPHPTTNSHSYRSTTRVARKRTLNVPERQPSGKNIPLLRDIDSPPPNARAGATTSHSSGKQGVPNSKNLPPPNTAAPKQQRKGNSSFCKCASLPSGRGWWKHIARACTCCFFPMCLRLIGKEDDVAQQAWREKVTLCLVIGFVMFAVGFLSFGLQPSLCPPNTAFSLPFFNMSNGQLPNSYYSSIIFNGYLYDYGQVRDRLASNTASPVNLTTDWYGVDISTLFRSSNDPCSPYYAASPNITCVIPNRFPGSPSLQPNPGKPCPDSSLMKNLNPVGRLYFTWDEISQAVIPPHMLLAYTSNVINITKMSSDNILDFQGKVTYPPNAPARRLSSFSGTDASLILSTDYTSISAASCIQNMYTVGYIDSQSVGCVSSNVIMSISLVVILGVVLTRFVMALTFHWIFSHNITRNHNSHIASIPPLLQSSGLRNSQTFSIANAKKRLQPSSDDPYMIMLVTCYSEGEAGIRQTLSSLADTIYPNERKLLFVVADGLITGSGNTKSTPDIVADMIRPFSPHHMNGLDDIEPKSYLAIADGTKQHNMAKVYAGYYDHKNNQVPIIAVIKTGTRLESTVAKPGNRGKRDSQLILMNFLSRVMFNDRMTPLDYELFKQIQNVAKVCPDKYEHVLMVDADTVVARDALIYMVQAMKNDDQIMGLCGETRIANKTSSWVSAIQVFEYYISHHLGKSFESMFGGVTCLPGCFSMYRIKAKKGTVGNWVVPILVNPDIVDEYSENVVNTLHKKNLLLLGEDRFLTTLMLRSFPKRKMLFIPQAKCETVVPDEFRVLLSQRRRWINSTIHNLLELVLLRDLCGIFCFSMQFVVMLELIGTVVLPAAICFTFYLILSAIITGNSAAIPLMILAGTLGLPGVLIIITTQEISYVGWMFVYLLALPIWNFVLPMYAFWHFDDFSWGATRKVEGETPGDAGHGDKEGVFQVGSVPLRMWIDWEMDWQKENAPQAHITPTAFLESVATAKGYREQDIERLVDPQRRISNMAEIRNLIGPDLTSRIEEDDSMLPLPPPISLESVSFRTTQNEWNTSNSVSSKMRGHTSFLPRGTPMSFAANDPSMSLSNRLTFPENASASYMYLPAKSSILSSAPSVKASNDQTINLSSLFKLSHASSTSEAAKRRASEGYNEGPFVGGGEISSNILGEGREGSGSVAAKRSTTTDIDNLYSTQNMSGGRSMSSDLPREGRSSTSIGKYQQKRHSIDISGRSTQHVPSTHTRAATPHSGYPQMFYPFQQQQQPYWQMSYNQYYPLVGYPPYQFQPAPTTDPQIHQGSLPVVSSIADNGVKPVSAKATTKSEIAIQCNDSFSMDKSHHHNTSYKISSIDGVEMPKNILDQELLANSAFVHTDADLHQDQSPHTAKNHDQSSVLVPPVSVSISSPLSASPVVSSLKSDKKTVVASIDSKDTAKTSQSLRQKKSHSTLTGTLKRRLGAPVPRPGVISLFPPTNKDVTKSMSSVENPAQDLLSSTTTHDGRSSSSKSFSVAVKKEKSTRLGSDVQISASSTVPGVARPSVPGISRTSSAAQAKPGTRIIDRLNDSFSLPFTKNPWRSSKEDSLNIARAAESSNSRNVLDSNELDEEIVSYSVEDNIDNKNETIGQNLSYRRLEKKPLPEIPPSDNSMLEDSSLDQMLQQPFESLSTIDGYGRDSVSIPNNGAVSSTNDIDPSFLWNLSCDASGINNDQSILKVEELSFLSTVGMDTIIDSSAILPDAPIITRSPSPTSSSGISSESDASFMSSNTSPPHKHVLNKTHLPSSMAQSVKQVAHENFITTFSSSSSSYSSAALPSRQSAPQPSPVNASLLGSESFTNTQTSVQATSDLTKSGIFHGPRAPPFTRKR